jgi:Zn-dependent protease with chaperone function
MIRHLLFLTLGFLLLGLGGPPASAGPEDARVGETRVVFNPSGTSLRREPKTLTATIITLQAGTQVVVQQVMPPWLLVSTGAFGGPGQSGWILATETTEPSAYTGPAPGSSRPMIKRPLGAAGSGASSQDVAAAGRMLDAETERGYRGQHPDLERAYPLVDAMERATDQMDQQTCIAFIRQGGLGGAAGSDLELPALLGLQQPSQPQPPQQPQGGGGLGGFLRGLPGGIVPDKVKKVVDRVAPLAESIQQYVNQVEKEFTPEQEYYLGRAVAANAIAKYGIDPDERLRQYVRMVGDAVVRTSTQLQPNWGGYHFDVLNTDAVNGVSGPGGFVLLTRGAVKACQNEDELAAILSHELGHVMLKHGETTLRKSKEFPAKMNVLKSGIGAITGQDQWLSKKVQFFDGIVGDSVRTSTEHAYGNAFEFDADQQSAYITRNVGYDWTAMGTYLHRLGRMPGHEQGSADHAAPEQRAQQLESRIANLGAYGRAKMEAIRASRFQQNVPH